MDNQQTREQQLQAQIDALQTELKSLRDERHAQPAALYFRALHKTALSLMQRRDVATLLEEIIERAVNLAGVEHGFVALKDADGQSMTIKIGIGLSRQYIGLPIAYGQGVTGMVWATGQRQIIYDYDNWDNRLDYVSRNHFAGLVALPLISGDDMIGVIAVSTDNLDKRFQQSELDILGNFADLASIVLDNARLYAELQEREQFINRIVAMSPGLLYVYDIKDHVSVFSNRDLAGMLGYGINSNMEINPGFLGAIMHPEDYERYLEYARQSLHAADGAVLEIDYRLHHADDTWQWYNSVNTPFSRDTDGTVRLVVGSTQNVHDQRAALESLRASEGRFRSLMETVPVLVFIYQNGHMTYINPIGIELSGYNEAEILADGFIEAVYGESTAHILEQITLYQTSGTLLPRQEIQVRTKQNTLHWLDLALVPIKIDGQSAVLGTGLDITERKANERRRIEVEGEKQRVTALATFVRNASHDFRTPLSVINTSVHMIENVTDPAKRHHHLDVIRGQVRHLDRLVESLLLMVKHDSEAPMPMQPINLVYLARDGMVNISSRAEEKKQTLHLNTLHKSIHVNANIMELQRAFNFLLDNAIRYTPSGGTITVTCDCDDDHGLLTVQDTGVGIDPEHLPHIFERFFRTDEARSTTGVGLGLSIARRIVERHGGQISAESTPGVGSTFKIAVPLLQPDTPESSS